MITYCVPARMAHVVADGPEVPANTVTVFLMELPDGSPLVLTGSAAIIWLVAADGEPDVAAAVADVVGMARDVVADDVARFLDGLVARGLLERRGRALDDCSP